MKREPSAFFLGREGTRAYYLKTATEKELFDVLCGLYSAGVSALKKLEWAKERFGEKWPLDLSPEGVAETHLRAAIIKAEKGEK